MSLRAVEPVAVLPAIQRAGRPVVKDGLALPPSSNPIGASGLLRFAEAALQVMGKAGTGARTALGHAYGGG